MCKRLGTRLNVVLPGSVWAFKWCKNLSTIAIHLGHEPYTHTHKGRFIMYSGITKIYGKTVGHVFTKPVQVEGKFFLLVSCFSS